MSTQNPQVNVELRLRTMRILWIAFFASIVMYYVMTFVVARPQEVKPNNTLFIALIIVGVLTVPISLFIKNWFLRQAIERQQMQLVQQGYVVALAVNEVAALLGLVVFFIDGNRLYFLLFIISACGLLLLFPRREDLINASYKRTAGF